MIFTTDRFIIRKLRLDDIEDFYDMQSNENVMRYIKPALNYEESKIELEKFIQGVSWDEEEDVRLMAIGCVTEVFKDIDGHQSKLLRCIYDVFVNEEEDEIIRSGAYETLAIISGKSIIDLPQPIHFNFERDVDPLVVSKIEKLLK